MSLRVLMPWRVMFFSIPEREREEGERGRGREREEGERGRGGGEI